MRQGRQRRGGDEDRGDVEVEGREAAETVGGEKRERRRAVGWESGRTRGQGERRRARKFIVTSYKKPLEWMRERRGSKRGSEHLRERSVGGE